MARPVRLTDIVEALEIHCREVASFVDLDTGKVETVTVDILGMAEEAEDGDPPELLDWQEDEWELAKRIVSTGRFLSLPSHSEIDDWSLMEEFSASVDSDRVRKDLLASIRGSGAFRRFKDAIRRHGVEESWFAFRKDALTHIAIAWCKENHLSYE
jgi:hypothetical protein